ncbi:MAG: nitroreductase family protein [Kiritimatiellae bacterium]|nr:nitroreductase family protein [Kiritimatiellia bacterium]
MKFLDLCLARRSVRSYSDRKVPREAIERCLEAARLAPSACNSQPWRFIVVDDETLRPELAKAAFSGLYAMNAFAREAPVLIVVITERAKYSAGLGGMFRGTRYALIDIGIAVEHLVLQAEEEGLGTCWLGWFNEKAVKKILGLPRSAKLDIMISLGYPAEGVEPREKKRRELDDMRAFR